MFFLQSVLYEDDLFLLVLSAKCVGGIGDQSTVYIFCALPVCRSAQSNPGETVNITLCEVNSKVLLCTEGGV